MSEPTVPLLKTPINPVNLRRGVAYGSLFPATAIEAEDDEQGLDGDTTETLHEHHGTETDHTAKDDGVLGGENDVFDQEWYLLDRIEECIAYTRSCLLQTPQRSLTRFYNISTFAGDRPSQACKMLRAAAQAGPAQLALSSDREEVYTVGAPPSVGSIGWGEHWWLGLTPAQVRRAESDLRKNPKRQQQARKNMNGRLNVERRKTEEGVRCQEQGMHMHGSDDEAKDDKAKDVEAVDPQE